MATKAQRLQQQDAVIAAYPAVIAELKQIKGKVEKFGFGLKEVNGLPTDEICLRVYVQEKQTDPPVTVPPVIAGIPVEVEVMFQVTNGPDENLTYKETERRDETEHRPVKGGICLSTKSVTQESRPSPEAGTLGWFVTAVPGNATLALTNAHVLWPNLDDTNVSDTPLTGADPLAQPIYATSCCCEQHVIGERIIGLKSADVDCGIASLSEEPALIIGNRSTPMTLRVDDWAKAAIGDKVRKIGKRSGYTEGIVIDIGAFPAGTMVPVPTIPGGTRHGTLESRVNKILIWPTTRPGFAHYFDDRFSTKMSFGNEGDSGSVVIDEDNNIVGLYYSDDEKHVRRAVGIACHIELVLTKLNDALKAEKVKDPKYNFQIEIKKSPPGGQNRGIAADFRLPRALTLNDLIRESDTLLGALVRRHRDEVSRLVNHCRPVTVVWHRHQGPAFAAAVNRNHREPAYRVPREINGVSRHELLVATARVLTQYGSTELQEDLRGHSFELIDELSRADNVRAVLFPPAVEIASAGNGSNGFRHGH